MQEKKHEEHIYKIIFTVWTQSYPQNTSFFCIDYEVQHLGSVTKQSIASTQKYKHIYISGFEITAVPLM